MLELTITIAILFAICISVGKIVWGTVCLLSGIEDSNKEELSFGLKLLVIGLCSLILVTSL